MKFICPLIFLMFMGFNMKAGDFQEFVLSGTVYDEETGEVLPGATVYIEELEKGVSTDDNGEFSIDLAEGIYTISFSYIGKKTVEKDLQLSEDTTISVYLPDRELSLEEIIVEGFEPYLINRRNIGVETLRISDLGQLPTVIGEVDVINTLETLPGVQTTGEGASGFHVRGGRSDHNLILMNGAQIFNPSHVLGLYSVFNPDVTSSFALYKGHVPGRYGGRLSSVLDVNLRRGSTENLESRGGIGLYSTRFLVEGPIKEGQSSFLIGGRGAWSEVIFAIAGKHRRLFSASIPNDIYNSNAHFYEGFSTYFNRINESNSVTASYFGNNDYFRYHDRFGYSWSNNAGNLTWSHIASENLLLETSLIVSAYRGANFTPSGFDSFELSSGITNVSLQEHLTYTGFDDHTFTFGVSSSFYNSHDETLQPNSENSVIESETVGKDQALSLSAYINDEFNLTDHIQLSAGLRFTRFSQVGPAEMFTYENSRAPSVNEIRDTTRFDSFEPVHTYSFLEPRIAIEFDVGRSTNVYLSYNRMQQYIHQISNTNSPTPSDTWLISNRYVPPQKSNNYSTGISRDFNDNTLNTSFELFYRSIDDLVEYADFANLSLNQHIETELISAEGRAYGGELSLVKSGGNWRGWLSYSYSRSFSRDLGLTINNGEWFPANFDQPHDLNLVLKRRVGDASAISMNFTYKTGRPISASEGFVFDGETTLPLFSERNKYRIPDYIRLDLSFTIAENVWKDRVVSPDRSIEDSMSFSFYNILGRRNAFSVFYQHEGRQEPDSYRLSVLGAMLPSITYNFKF